MTDTPDAAALRARVAEAETVIRGLLDHSCVSDSAPEDKFPEDRAAESAALRFLSAAPAVPRDVVQEPTEAQYLEAGRTLCATPFYEMLQRSVGMHERRMLIRAVHHALAAAERGDAEGGA